MPLASAVEVIGDYFDPGYWSFPDNLKQAKENILEICISLTFFPKYELTN